MADMSSPLYNPQVKSFIDAFPGARLDPTAIAESFKETPECAPATRVIRLKTLHRALPRQARITLNTLAEAYQFAPCLATLQADRLLGKISGADKLFGDGRFLPLFLQEPEKFAPLLQYNAGDFISLALNCSRPLKKLNLPDTALPEMVIREPKLLGLEPTTLSAHLVALAEEAIASEDPSTLAALQKTLLEKPSTLLKADKSLSFYVSQATSSDEPAPSPTPAEVQAPAPLPLVVGPALTKEVVSAPTAPQKRKNTPRPRATAHEMENGIAATLAAAQAFKKVTEEPSSPKIALPETPTEINTAPQADAPKPQEKILPPPAPKPAPNSPKKALNAKGFCAPFPKKATENKITGSIRFGVLQQKFNNQNTSVKRQDVMLDFLKKVAGKPT